MNHKKIVLLGGTGISTSILYNSVNAAHGIGLVILEEKENSKVFIKRRIKRLGIVTVIGQLTFQVVVSKFLTVFSKKRRLELIHELKLDLTEIPEEKIRRVKSVNAPETLALLQETNPDLIIVNGTRIISKKVISSVACRFVNTHAGITPKYRGVHGAYWALANNDPEHCGVTVHFVDEGIDTGTVIAQKKVVPQKKDNFTTYPLLQLSAGLELLNTAITSYFNKTLTEQKEVTTESKLWYHPTVWFYMYNRIFKNIK
ncbi:formyl transferase [Flavobacterium sp. SM15]|uniref:formyl transferase n=1 Tax=Flavobacterium sp. SM15 TaxID=2908005 RepID=UPI001EDB56D8|nr:formyl transferase [Flavobacterium sp. SM15]MCG2611290.1 formyl transferase [Flavobacterium sp. SM15]